jgi:haloalkane dehalogenase
MKKIVGTPESRFENLPDYHFASHYMNVKESLRLYYLDEGGRDHPIVLLLHGEPSWSYLYRKIILILVRNNFRVIAPDLIGFGKSDKLVNTHDYSYQGHLGWMRIRSEKMFNLKDQPIG